MFQQRPSTCAVWFNHKPVEYHTFKAGNESNRGKFERRNPLVSGDREEDRQIQAIIL